MVLQIELPPPRQQPTKAARRSSREIILPIRGDILTQEMPSIQDIVFLAVE